MITKVDSEFRLQKNGWLGWEVRFHAGQEDLLAICEAGVGRNWVTEFHSGNKNIHNLSQIIFLPQINWGNFFYVRLLVPCGFVWSQEKSS